MDSSSQSYFILAPGYEAAISKNFAFLRQFSQPFSRKKSRKRLFSTKVRCAKNIAGCQETKRFGIKIEDNLNILTWRLKFKHSMLFSFQINAKTVAYRLQI